MSTFRAQFINPRTNAPHRAWCIDDFFEHHRYGIKFDGETRVYDPRRIELTEVQPAGDCVAEDFHAAVVRDLNVIVKPSLKILAAHKTGTQQYVNVKLKTPAVCKPKLPVRPVVVRKPCTRA